MSNEQASLKGLSVWIVCVLFYLYEFLLRTILGTFQTPITLDLNLNPLNFALLSSTAFLFIYGIMQVPVGAILGKFGLKKGLFFAAVICTLSTLGFALSSNYEVALLLRSLMGLGSAFGFIGVLYALYDWMPYKNIAFYIGISQFLGTLGPMAAGGPLSALAHSSSISWRVIFFALSIMGFILALLIVFFVDKNRKIEGGFFILKKPRQITKELVAMMRDKQVWYIALYCAFNYFSLEYLSENECKNLLMAKGFSSNFSSYMITLAWLGFAIGSPICGYFSDKVSKRKPFLLLSSAFVLFSLTLIIYLPLSEIGISILFLMFGMGVGGGTLGIVIMGEQFQSQQVSTGLGVNNSFAILFVSLLAPCISFLLTFIAKGTVYSLVDFQYAFLVLVLLPLLSLITLFKIKETFAKSSKELIILKLKSND